MAVDREPRDAARVLTGLLAAGEEQLGAFRERRAANSKLDLVHLARAREIVLEVYRAVRSEEPEVWERVEKAWLALREEEPVTTEAGGVRDTTAEMSALTIDDASPGRAVVPFDDAQAFAPTPAEIEALGHVAAGATLPGTDLGETLPFDEPFEVSLDPHLFGVTVEQYAALCAECIVRPGSRAAIHERYQISGEAQRRCLDELWRRRMSKETGLSERFQELYAQYERWARSREAP